MAHTVLSRRDGITQAQGPIGTLGVLAGAMLAAILTTQALPSHAADSRHSILTSCAKQAQDKKLEGEAHADFMRGCLKAPQGAEPLAFSASAPAPAPAGGLKPALTAPRSPKQAARAKPGSVAPTSAN